MADTPRVPLQGNVVLSPTAPSVEGSDGKTVIIADGDVVIVVIDDGVAMSVDALLS
jgi:hypothetical protein